MDTPGPIDRLVVLGAFPLPWERPVNGRLSGMVQSMTE